MLRAEAVVEGLILKRVITFYLQSEICKTDLEANGRVSTRVLACFCFSSMLSLKLRFQSSEWESAQMSMYVGM